MDDTTSQQQQADDDDDTAIMGNSKQKSATLAANNKEAVAERKEAAAGAALKKYNKEFFKQAIDRYRRGREEAASSSSMRAAMEGVSHAAIANSQVPSKSNLVSNSSGGSNATTTSDDHSPSPNDESDTSTSSDRDKTSSSSNSDGDGENPNSEDVIVNLETKKTAEEDDAKQAAVVVSEESGSGGNNASSTDASSSLAVQVGITDSKSTVSGSAKIPPGPSEVDVEDGDDELEEDGEEEEDEDDEDAAAREAVGTLLGLHESGSHSHHLKPPPTAFSSEVAQGPTQKRKERDVSVKMEDEGCAAPLKKRRYQKRGTTEDATPTEGMSEVERKRLASRISSRRTREREKMRGEYFRTIRKKLEKKNRKLRDENAHIRSLLKKTKKEIAKKTSANAALPPAILGSTTSAAAASPATVPQDQNQVLPLLLQQLIGNQNSDNESSDSQSQLQNPAVLALLVAVLQQQSQSNPNQSIPIDVLLPLLQAVSQSQNGVLQLLLPLLLGTQGGDASNNGNQQQLLLQLLPLLMNAQQGGETKPAQQPPQQLPVGGTPSSAPPLQSNTQLDQLASLPGGQGSNLPVPPKPTGGDRQTSQGYIPSISQPQPLQVPALATKAPAPAAAPATPQTNPMNQASALAQTQPLNGMMGTQTNPPPPSQVGINPVEQAQLQQVAMMMQSQGQQMTPQMQQQLLVMMSIQQGHPAGVQQTAQRPYSNQAQLQQAEPPPLSTNTVGMKSPPTHAFQPQQSIQQMQMQLQQLQAQQSALPNQQHFAPQQQLSMPFPTGGPNQAQPNLAQAQMMMMQPQQMQQFATMMARGGNIQQQSFSTGNNNNTSAKQKGN